MTTREVELIEARDLSPGVRWLRFRLCDGEPLAFVAGQWVNLFVRVDGELHKRAYSLAGVPPAHAPDTFEVAVTRVGGGAMSNALHALRPFERCQADGPHGLFTRAGLLDQPALFVGTGTGLCPLRAMVQEALVLPPVPLTVLFGCRHEEDILWRDQLAEWEHRHPHVHVHVTLSRPGPGWQGRSGYVQTHLGDLIDVNARPHVFICGLTHMVKAVRAQLKETLGYHRKQIHSERYD